MPGSGSGLQKRTSCDGWHRAAGRLHRPATALVVAFIDEHKQAFGVEPICRVLCAHGVKIAPSTYYAHHARPPAPRTIRDQALGDAIERIYRDRQLGRGLAGVRKMWRLLRRDREMSEQFGPIARCTVARLMCARGLAGVRRGKPGRVRWPV